MSETSTNHGDPGMPVTSWARARRWGSASRGAWVPLEWTAPGADLRGAAEARAESVRPSAGQDSTSLGRCRRVLAGAGLGGHVLSLARVPLEARTSSLSLWPITPPRPWRGIPAAEGWVCSHNWMAGVLPALTNSLPTSVRAPQALASSKILCSVAWRLSWP